MTSTPTTALFRTCTDYEGLIEHPQECVRSWALERIRRQYPWRYTELVPKMLEDSATRVQLRGLGELTTEQAENHSERLTRLAESLPPENRWVALRLLASRGDESVCEGALQIIRRSTETIDMESYQACLVLKETSLSGSQILELLDSLKLDEEFEVRLLKIALSRPEVGSVRPVLLRRKWKERELVDLLSACLDGEARGLVDQVAGSHFSSPEEFKQRLELWLDQPLPSEVVAQLDSWPEPAEVKGVLRTLGQTMPSSEDRSGRPGGFLSRSRRRREVMEVFCDYPAESSDEVLTLLTVGVIVATLSHLDTDDETARSPQGWLKLLKDSPFTAGPHLEKELAATPEVVPELLKIVSEGNFWARRRALSTLEECLSRGPLELELAPLVSVLADPDEDYNSALASKILQSQGARAIECAADLLKLEDDFVPGRAMGVLGEIPAQESFDILVSVPEADTSWFYAMKALAHPESYAVVSERASTHWDPDEVEVLQTLAWLTMEEPEELVAELESGRPENPFENWFSGLVSRGSAPGPERRAEPKAAHEWVSQPETTTFVRERPKIGRNDPCWCGSGKKYKKCHLKLEE